MGAVVHFWQFGKRSDSTKIPDIDMRYMTRQCDFLEPMDILSPTIILPAETGDETIDHTPSINYVEIPDLRRYYWVTGWTYNRGRWFATTRVDPLGSWRYEIGRMTPYVCRSSARYSQTLIDGFYPTQTMPVILQSQPDNAERWHDLTTTGIYVLTIVNNDNTSGSGGVSYYALTRDNFLTFREHLLGSTSYLAIPTEEISEELTKALVNPTQYITACRWLPIDYATVPTVERSSIKVGWWTVTAAYKPLPGNSLIDTFDWDFTIPQRPDGLTPWRYASHLSKYTLTLPCYGIIDYPVQYLRVPPPIGNIKVRVALDAMTGTATYRIYAHGVDLPVMMIDAQVGVDIPLAFGQRDLIGAAAGVGQAIVAGGAGFASAGLFGVAANAGQIFGGMASAAQDYQPAVNTLGGNGSFAKFLTHPTLTATYYLTAAEDIDHFGRPCSWTDVHLDEISGFIKCSEADPDFPATEPEKEVIKAALLEGMYWE